jgi:dTDP-4-dehydrorhamnose reductase
MRIVVTGASGFIGRAFMQVLSDQSLAGICFSHPKPGLEQLDLRDRDRVGAFLSGFRPDVVIHCAARPTVDWCEHHEADARVLNVGTTATLAQECARLGATLVFISTDYVFDGTAGPYSESDATRPINVYGRLKLEGEEIIGQTLDNHIIVRTTNVYGFDVESKNFLMGILPRLARGEQIKVASDQFGNPTFITDLCLAVRELIEKECRGVFHVVGPDWMNRVRWAQQAAEAFGLDPALVTGALTEELNQPAPRPRLSGLISRRLNSVIETPLLNLSEGLQAMRRQMEMYSPEFELSRV